MLRKSSYFLSTWITFICCPKQLEMMCIAVNECGLSQQGGAAVWIRFSSPHLAVWCKWPGPTTHLLVASQIAGIRPKRRSLASPDTLASLTQTYKVPANVTKGSPLNNWYLKVRSLPSRMVKKIREAEGSKWLERKGGKGRKAGPSPCAACPPREWKLQGCACLLCTPYPTCQLWSQILAL